MKKIYLFSSGAKLVEDAIENSQYKDRIEIINPVINNKLLRILRKIHYTLRLPLKHVWIKKYKFQDDSIFIFFDTPIWFENIEYISKKNKNSKIIFWYWNIIKDKKDLEKVRKITNNIYTFDKNDSKKYELNYHPQFYWLEKQADEEEIYDVLFVGKNKGRLSEIERIFIALKKENLKVKFYVVKDKKSDTSKILDLYDEFLKYDEVVEYIKKSRAILDINQSNQSGLTLRALEALFFEKKLITNNEDIVNYDFYDPRNVLLLKQKLELKNFLKIHLKRIDKRVTKEYSVNSWLRNLLNGEEH